MWHFIELGQSTFIFAVDLRTENERLSVSRERERGVSSAESEAALAAVALRSHPCRHRRQENINRSGGGRNPVTQYFLPD